MHHSFLNHGESHSTDTQHLLNPDYINTKYKTNKIEQKTLKFTY